MEFIQNFIDWFTEIFDTIFGFFSSLIDNFVQLFKYIGLAASTAYSLVDSLPPWLQAFGTATVLISVLFMIIGRSTGGSKSD